MKRRALVIGFGALAAAAGGFALRRSPARRGVTRAEAETLAAMLFLNHEDGGAQFTAKIPGRAGETVLDGRLDWRNHLATGRVTSPGSTPGVLAWGLLKVASYQPADRRWAISAIEATGDRLHVVLALSLRLAQDRPENPQLLINNDASWLRRENGLTVYSGPRVLADGRVVAAQRQRLEYGLDDMGRLRRLRLLSADAPAEITFGAFGNQDIGLEQGIRDRLAVSAAVPAR